MKTYQKMKYFLRKLRYLESLDLSPEVRAKLKVAQETRCVYLALLCGGTREAKYTYLRLRAENMCEIIQYIVDNPLLWNCVQVREFLEIGPNSFDPFYGDKGPEGYLWKISGGYEAGFSRSTGDYVSVGNRRWISFSPTQITWYRSHIQDEVKGTLKITPDTTFYLGGSDYCCRNGIRRNLVIHNPIRTLVVQFWDRSDADRWLLRILRILRQMQS